MKKIESYFLKREENIKSLLRTPREKYTIETFHELRVEIKKIHALIDLLENCLKKFNAKKIKSALKKVFEKAGRVRESEKKLKRKFDLLERNIIPALDRVKRKDLVNYFDKNRLELQSKLSHKLRKAEDLHSLRKQLKLYYYNLKGIGMDKIGKDKLSELIGEWHDCHINIEQLKKGMLVIKNRKEAAEIQMIIDKQMRRRETLAKRIRMNVSKVKLPVVVISFF